MSFIQPCFIRKNTLELRKKLEEIDIHEHPAGGANGSNYLFVNRGFYSSMPIGYIEEIGMAIDCGTNENLFLALAALRDDTDKRQWFVLDADWGSLLLSPERTIPKGTFVLNYADRWFVDILEDGSPNPISSANIPAHKATVKEILDYFNKI